MSSPSIRVSTMLALMRFCSVLTTAIRHRNGGGTAFDNFWIQSSEEEALIYTWLVIVDGCLINVDIYNRCSCCSVLWDVRRN